jgi:hypothetical protein
MSCRKAAGHCAKILQNRSQTASWIRLLKQLVNAGTQGSTADEHGLNFMVSVVKGIEPKDQVEAMLAAQMATVIKRSALPLVLGV